MFYFYDKKGAIRDEDVGGESEEESDVSFRIAFRC